MKTLTDILFGACFFSLLILFQSWHDESKARIKASIAQETEQARLDGVTQGAKAVAMKCGTVAGYINVENKHGK